MKSPEGSYNYISQSCIALSISLVKLTQPIEELQLLPMSGVGLQGAGTAAVFSTTFLWLETLMPVTNAIGAAYTVAWNVAVQVRVILFREFAPHNNMDSLFMDTSSELDDRSGTFY